MGKIVMSGPQNVSLDGVVQDPTARRASGWAAGSASSGARTSQRGTRSRSRRRCAPRRGCWVGEATSSSAMRWRPRSGELADRLNSMPKYVVSSTLEDPEWNNSTVLKGDVVTEVSKLKQELDGEIVVPASYQLGRTLIEHDLVDELRLVVFPVVLGAGERLFGETGDKQAHAPRRRQDHRRRPRLPHLRARPRGLAGARRAAGAVRRDRVAVRARRAAEASRPVAREVEDEAVAAVVGAHRQAREFVGADDVDHRHRGFDDDAAIEGRVGGRGVDVPVEPVVAHELRERVGPRRASR